MFIKTISITNFRLFQKFEITEVNVPDEKNNGSGLTVFVGENGCGKSTLLDAIALPLLSYKADAISLADFYNPNERMYIEALSQKDFNVDSTMPRANPFKAKGFSFEAGLRKRDNKAYLSSVLVSDQKYIKPNGQEKPKDNSPDLRVSVNNPFKGPRFNENDILFLDRNRTFQARSGTYNETRFDRLMEDFNFQHLKVTNETQDVNDQLSSVLNNVENTFLTEAIKKFKEISGSDITLNFINNLEVFSQCFFAEKKQNNQQIPINMLGSGYEMIFSLLYSFYLSQQSNKQLILLIDEPELHLHPKLQSDFVKLLVEFSKTAQIILTTHSPLLVKQLFIESQNIKLNVLSKKDNQPELVSMESCVLPYISTNEINFLAFGLVTAEYHNELYGNIQEKIENDRADGVDEFLVEKGIVQTKEWIKQFAGGKQSESRGCTLPNYIRHATHHPENNLNEPYTQTELEQSINQMRNILQND